MESQENEDNQKKCFFCGKKLDSFLPFQCKRCGNYYCSEHRLPESHDCIIASVSKRGMENWKKEQQKFTKTYDRDKKYPSKTYSSHHKKKSKSYKTHDRRRRFKKYTLWQTFKYRLRRLGIPLGFLYSIVLIIIFYFLYQVYSNGVLAIIFYILEIVIIFYIMFAILKKLDRISIHNDLRLFGLRLLGGIIGAIGIYLFFLFMIFGMPLIMMLEYSNLSSMISFYNMIGVGFMVPIFTLGLDAGLPLTGFFIYFGIIIGLMLIGGYLLFKFKRRSGQFVWFGRI